MATRAIHSEETADKNIFMNFLEALPIAKKKKFLRALHEDEVMRFCSSEEEFRMITGKDMPADFPGGFKPLRTKESDVDERSLLKDIQERFDEIEDSFPIDLEDVKEKAQPSFEVSITINNMREKANKLAKE